MAAVVVLELAGEESGKRGGTFDLAVPISAVVEEPQAISGEGTSALGSPPNASRADSAARSAASLIAHVICW